MINSTMDMSGIIEDRFTGSILARLDSSPHLDWSEGDDKHTNAGVPPLFRQIICIKVQCDSCEGARIPEMFDNRCQKDVYAHEGCHYLELKNQEGQN